MKVSTSTHDMEIWDYDHDSGSSMDECFFRDTATYNACYDDLCYGVSYSIGSSYIGGYHYIVQNSPITKDNALVWSYDSACSFSGSDSRDYYVIDQKKTVCSDSTHFMYYGRFGTGANDWEDYSDSFTCGIGSGCDSQQDEQTCTTQSCMPQSPCRRLENSSCNISNSDVTDDCYSGLNCTNNICKNMSGATTDLVITNIIPIQVVKGTDLVVGKTTLVRTYVLNNGTQSVNARVIVTIQTDLINTFQQHIIGPKNIPANTTIYFDTEFKPTKITSNGNITAEVEIYE
jgi:hypothetical protein